MTADRDAAEGAVIRAIEPARRKDGDRPVLVTGGAGFLGSNLVDRLAREGRRVVVLDSLARPGVGRNLAWLQAEHGARVVATIADVLDPAILREAVREAAAVIHLAAQVAVTTSLEDPWHDFEVNAVATVRLLEALRARPEPPPLLFASTNKVYGALLEPELLTCSSGCWQPLGPMAATGVDERTPLDLQSPYGCSKGAADQYVLDYARVFGLPTAVFRMSCLYGPRQFGTEDQGWVAHFLFATLEGRPITLYGDGRQVRDVLYVDDAVDAYVRALGDIDRARGRAFNLGGGPGCAASLLEMLARIERVTGIAPVIGFADWRPGDQRWFVSDTRRLGAATGWRQRTGIDEGLRRLLAWAGTYRREQELPAAGECRPLTAPRRAGAS